MVRTIKAGLAFTALAGAFLLQPWVHAQDNMKHDKMQDDKIMHHGKAKTLRDVLTTCNKEDKHGKTSHLKEVDIDDLVEFVRSLPYEKPPTETPNTVKYRVAPARKEHP